MTRVSSTSTIYQSRVLQVPFNRNAGFELIAGISSLNCRGPLSVFCSLHEVQLYRCKYVGTWYNISKDLPSTHLLAYVIECIDPSPLGTHSDNYLFPTHITIEPASLNEQSICQSF